MLKINTTKEWIEHQIKIAEMHIRVSDSVSTRLTNFSIDVPQTIKEKKLESEQDLYFLNKLKAAKIYEQ
jgi:hypothetical protein